MRPTPRAAASAEHLAFLAHRLTPRDRWLARMLFEHTVLTTHQIAQLAWGGLRGANLRLLNLYRWRVVDRFQPRLDVGTAPMHYVLDVAGAAILAYEEDLEPSRLKFRHDQVMGHAHSLRLAHTVGTNGFFTPMIETARRSESPGRLSAWWSETTCFEYFGEHVRPDAYGRWRQLGGDMEWFLEFDTGTERPARRLASKINGYAKLATITGITTPVLIWTPTVSRESALRHALVDILSLLAEPDLVPLATATIEQATSANAKDPSEAEWLPLGPRRTLPRVKLVDLGTAWPELRGPSGGAPPSRGSNQIGGKGSVRLTPPTPMPPTAGIAARKD
ncbi:replication-relaxation family protein [Embleya sp. NPDC055664]